MKSIKILVTFLVLLPYWLSAQSIKNVKASLENNKIIICYDLSGGKFYNNYKISLYTSRDGGKTFEGPLQEVSGDVGEKSEGDQIKLYGMQ